MTQLRLTTGSKQMHNLAAAYWSVKGNPCSIETSFSIDRQPELSGVQEGSGYA